MRVVGEQRALSQRVERCAARREAAVTPGAQLRLAPFARPSREPTHREVGEQRIQLRFRDRRVQPRELEHALRHVELDGARRERFADRVERCALPVRHAGAPLTADRIPLHAARIRGGFQ
jgi:hypothetical protein